MQAVRFFLCRQRTFTWTAIAWLGMFNPAAAVAGDVDDFFRDRVAPVFQRRCLTCHNAVEHKGDFSLQTAGDALESGYIEAGDVAGSHLVEVITPAGGQAQMPKDADALTAAEIADIRTWIADGAAWPKDFALSEPRVADYDWWSWRPLRRPEVPDIQSPWLQTPIDAFVLAKLREHELSPSAPADRRTLARRLYFDLLGLPPTPRQISEFADDRRPDAYERLVDRLLASPHYGERWARHWMDIVHYADTHGYDKDKPRPNAWPFRDYLIRAFNEDRPYDRFIREQIAGDVLFPGTRHGIVATGFIAAGPWDFIGHAEVPETKTDGMIARHLDRDDMVTSTMNTFVSMTVQCARCHNHKFDPITQEHYYRLQAVFAALDRADRSYDADPRVARRRLELATRLGELQQKHQSLLSAVEAKAGGQLANVDAEIRQLEKQQRAPSERSAAFGYHSQVMSTADHEKWVQVDLGDVMPIRDVVYVGCHDDFNGIGHGFGFPVRYKIEVSNDARFRDGVTTIVDRTASDQPNPGTTPQSVRVADVEARFVRVTATKLAPRKNDYIFALAELSVIDDAGRNVALGKSVTSLDSIEAPVRWTRGNLVDGYYFGVAASAATLATMSELKERRRAILDQAAGPETAAELADLAKAIREVQHEVAQLPPQEKVYAGTIHTGSGAFRGTGHTGGQPREIRLLHRGDVRKPGDMMQPGTVPLTADQPSEFALPETHAESDRRVALADWISDAENSLTWRSIVNRVWQYHFGAGIVATPNDFGRMGQQPTHPELLDWLAVEFRDGITGQSPSPRALSIKSLHKLIVMSAAYQQSSAHNEAAAAIDGDNQYLWRMNRRRLTAEETRDAVLAASGMLDTKMYGPGYQAFVIEKPQHSPHYQYDQYDPSDRRTHRRAVYRFVVRSQPDPFMTTLDCADSSQSVPKRTETVTALQALALLNNRFMLTMAERFAERMEREADDVPGQVSRAFSLATGRRPTVEQQQQLVRLAEDFGLAATCRLILNLNEFVFID